MSTKTKNLVTPLDPEPGQCCQHLREEVAMLEAAIRQEQRKLHAEHLKVGRLQSQVKEEQAVNRRLVCALEQAEDEAKRLEQGLTPPGSRRSQDHKLADLLAKWLHNWKEDYSAPPDGELAAKTEEALEDFYGVHPPLEEP